MKIINQSLLDIDQGIICQQVNCQKVMGSGLALSIRKKWPIVYEEYKKIDGKLGDIDLVKVSFDLYVANLYGQDRYGRDKRYTDYDAVRMCLKKLKEWDKQIYIPCGMGCTLGGGNWSIVCKMIEEELPNAILCNYK